MKISITPFSSMISQVRWGSNFGSRIVRWPANRCIEQPGLRPAVHERAQRKGDHPAVLRGLLGLVELRQRLAGVEVDAAAEHPPEVLVAPHHALREAGGATGVDDVQVVGAALLEVAGVALPSHRVGVQDASVGGDVGLVVGLDHVRHHDDGLEPRVVRSRLGDQRGVGALVDQRDHVGVVEQVVQLALDVAVVHVDVDRADLDDREHRDDVLDAVLGVDRHMLSGLHPLRLEVMGQPVGPGLQLGEGDDPLTHLHGRLVGRRVDGMLEEVSDVQGHAPETRTRSRSWLGFPT